MILDPKYNPNFFSDIKPKSLIGPGVSIAKFLVGSTSGTQTFNDLSYTAKSQVTRNLCKQVEFIQSVNGRFNNFNNNRLIVKEGVYFPGPQEVLGGLNILKNQGRCVVYSLIDSQGKVDISASYDLAVYWKDHFQYDGIYLAYDNFNPDGTLNVNIIVTMPNMPSTFNSSYNNNIATYYNSNVDSSSELIEYSL